MPNEDKNIGGSLVLNLSIWWRQVKTLYIHKIKLSDRAKLKLSATAKTKLKKRQVLKFK